MSNPSDAPSRSGRLSALGTWASIWEPLLVAGVVAVAIFFNHRAGPDSWPYGWTAIFVSLGTLFLGFGAGMLFYQRRQRALSANLRNDFANLSARTRALSAEMDDLIKRKQASGS